uniref:Polyglutamine-binding protein 1 n=1 Tax=Heterorhabditis bacteriophora TaxID=37862 RepID=A0A1I7XSD6_HETBA
MTLPPALLARLQKRGIVRTVNEEVIAESYDSTEAKERKTLEENIAGAPGCPNKYNPYHVCVEFCYDQWREGIPEIRLSDSYLRKRRRMLAKFPLPEGWVEVYDAGVARHYYWNQDTDEVCWVSPRHPVAVIGEPAPRVAKEMIDRMDGSSQADKMETTVRGILTRFFSNPYFLVENNLFSYEKRKRTSNQAASSSSIQPKKAETGRARRKGIDPMDPAAYGEAPVGKWSAGLHAHDKTGADVTASGPLFQQRPYPAPGAILRQQKKRQDENDCF